MKYINDKENERQPTSRKSKALIADTTAKIVKAARPLFSEAKSVNQRLSEGLNEKSTSAKARSLDWELSLNKTIKPAKQAETTLAIKN